MSNDEYPRVTVNFTATAERYYSMIAEVQDYAIILLDRDGFIQNWNKGAEKIKLYKESEILGNHFSIFYLPEDKKDKLPERLIGEAAEKGRASHEGWRLRKDGTKFWGNITITALHGSNGDVIGFSKVTRDLTERKIGEDQLKAFAEELKQKNELLRSSEERYHQMIAEVQDYAIILMNIEGNIENWNAGAEYIKGYTAEEILGRNFEIFYTPEDRQNNLPKKLLAEATSRGKAVQEGWRVRKDGSRFWGSIVITALHRDDGKLIGFSKVTRDLTERKIKDDKLLAYTAELESQNKELEQFAYVASHDLQEPLRKILTFSEIIQNNLQDEKLARYYFDKINASARRMSELIRSVLNFSRLAKDGADIADVSLNEILATVRTELELQIIEKNATILCDDLPVIRGNPLQLSQLFFNLISNALKFSDKIPAIEIRGTIVQREQVINKPDFLTDDTYIGIDIIDNGIGFDQEYGLQIFKMFQRLHGKHQYEGTGIGLALCKKIVENHKGYIAAKSELGKGAVFYVYLPL